jgi:hypothetical protein
LAIVTSERFTDTLAALSAVGDETSFFDGVGGDMLGDISQSLPVNSTICFYGLLGGAAPASILSVPFMIRTLAMERFSNFDGGTENLVAALKALEGVIDDPMLIARIGEELRHDQIGLTMATHWSIGPMRSWKIRPGVWRHRPTFTTHDVVIRGRPPTMFAVENREWRARGRIIESGGRSSTRRE